MVSCWKATFTESKLLTITFVANFWFEIFVPVLDLKVSFEQKAGIHDYLILKTSISGPLLFANPYVILPLLIFFCIFSPLSQVPLSSRLSCHTNIPFN